MACIELDGVSKSYGRGAAAVRDIDLRVEDREFLVLVGPSGCGKTTTLRLIAGLESCGEGEIRIGDRVVNHVAPKDRNIAMVFQNYALYPHMSVYKNMAFGLELRYGGGWLARGCRRLFRPRRAAELEARRREIPERIRRTTDSLGITHLTKRKPHMLSGGERQRVALGRAIVREPAAFLFDEPLSNLDARLRTEMRVELKRLHQRLGATMVYVTHDQVEAMTLGDRIAVMHAGRLLQLARPLDAYDRPADTFVATFLGSPGMNLVEGRLASDDEGLRLEAAGAALPLPLSAIEHRHPGTTMALQAYKEKNIILGVRPEHLSARESTGDHDRLTGEVVAVDRLGDSAMLYLNLIGGEGPADAEGTALRTAGDAVSDRGDHRERPTGRPTDWVVKTTARIADPPGRRCSLEIDWEHTQFFDPGTGSNLVKAERI